MRVFFKPCINGEGVELVAEASGCDVGAGGEGGRKGVMVWSEMIGRVNLVEEVKSIQELVGTSTV